MPPHRNRVAPTGEIVAVPLRGAWTGNRGCLHRGTEIVRQWASPHWLICTLQYKGIRREQWVPRRLTWLFFHDEAVAFAAGHRPCALCRREAYNAFRVGWAGGGRAGCRCTARSTGCCTMSGWWLARVAGARTGSGGRSFRTGPS